MARRLRVQHWVACLEARVEPPVGPQNFYNLLRVGYTYTGAADTEFPWSVRRMDMFARFVRGVGVAEFEIRLVWEDAPEGPREVENFGPWRIRFRPGDPTRDNVFRLLNVPIDGPGRYQLELQLVKSGRNRLLAIEYFRVVRRS